MGNKKLYIGNLSYSVDSTGLESMCAPFGTVESAKVITDRDSGRSKGFGFVEMSSSEEAEAAISSLNGRDFDGRKVNVTLAKPQAPREGGGGGGGRGGFGSRRY